MADITKKERKFIYRTSVSWAGEKRGLLRSPGKPAIEVATPVEFKGHPGLWTPEELFVASVNICIMTTFLYVIEREGMDIKGYESPAEGILEMTDKGLSFSKVEVSPEILIARGAEPQKIEEAFRMAEERCLISNSITCQVTTTPRIRAEA